METNTFQVNLAILPGWLTPILHGLGFFISGPGLLAAELAWQQSAAGLIDQPALRELSGMAASRSDARWLWVLNDSGNEAALFALSQTGEMLGTVEIEGASNTDWEDLASFAIDGQNYLLIGDTGDNAGWRREGRLYLIKEPEAGMRKVKPLAVLAFTFADGARDVESLAVDAAGRKILLLSKREKVPALYELPLVLESTPTPLTAQKIATLDSLPQPTREERQANPSRGPYLGQPTAMDVSADGSSLAVLTYQGLFIYHRESGEAWPAAVSRPPLILPRHGLHQAEAMCFSPDGKIIFVTSEQQDGPSPLLRYEMKN